jgi:hypothetical protein
MNRIQGQSSGQRTHLTSGGTLEKTLYEISGLETETNGRDFKRVMQNQELAVVEGSAPSEAEKEVAYGVRAGYGEPRQLQE